MSLTKGTRLGPYEITGQIGAGGMGEVYRATDSKLGRDVAIKTLPAALASDKDRLARFEREAKLLAALNHPHIASVYSLDEHEGTLYLAMELVEGETLEEKLKPGALPVEDALRLALQIAEALEAAHDKGVVHRDLKPANVMVTRDGIVKVLDFGLAKAFSEDPNESNVGQSPALSVAMTQQGLVLGTAGYMSPEQASGQQTDQRADIWAFGVVLYEMLTGLPLFSGESVPHILADVLKTEPDWNRLPGNLHPRLRLALERCLTKKPKNRYSGIADARVDIEYVLANPEGSSEPAIAQDKPRRGIAAILLAGAAAAIVTGLGVWALMPNAEPGPVVRFPHILPEDQNFWRPELSMIAVSPDGTRMAYVANSQIYVRNLNETESRPVDGTDVEAVGGPASPVFSPDGEWLAFVEVLTTAQSVLKRVPISGGTAVTLFEGGFQRSPSWPTPDTIVFSHDTGIVRIPANGGAPEVLVERADNEVFGSPQILPGGDAVLFSRAEGSLGQGAWASDTQVMVQTIGARDRTLAWNGGAAARLLPTGHLIYAQGNTLFAIPFDEKQREVVGGPVPMVERVRRSSTFGTDAANYAVSDTGTLVVIPGDATDLPESALVLVDRNGNASPLAVPPAQYRNPRISPDGERLAVEAIDASGLGHIWVYELAGDSSIRRLTQSGDNWSPVWTPDSLTVTFASERDGGTGIYERLADGSTLAVPLTSADEGRSHTPSSWSPDNETLVYRDGPRGGAAPAIWVLSRSSGESDLFAGGEAGRFAAAFSPDGRWIAYSTNQPVGIEVQPFPATGSVQRITEGSVAPVWSAAGDELFYRTGVTEGRQQMVGLEVTADASISFRNQREMPIQPGLTRQGFRDFDITPDGERFVMVYPANETDTAGAPIDRIDIVLNWYEELLTRVPIP